MLKVETRKKNGVELIKYSLRKEINPKIRVNFILKIFCRQ